MKHNWEYKQFTDIATSITPRIKVDKSDYLLEGPVPIISQEESYISGYWDNLDDITPHNGPVIIFGDHSRVLKYVDCDFVVGADGVKIISPKDCICAKFLFHFLKWYNIPSLGYSRHFKLIKDATFPVPPMEVQERIVAELDKINETIEDCRELLRNLDALAQSLFYEYFGKFYIDNSPHYKSLKEVFDTVTDFVAAGSFASLRENVIYQDSPNYAQLVRTMDIKSNFTKGQFVFVDKHAFDFLWRVNLDKECIILPNIGNCGEVYHLKPSNLIYDNNVLGPNAILVRSSKYNHLFLSFALKSDDFQKQLSKITSQVAQPKFNKTNLKELKVLIPPLALQEQFAARIEQIEEQKKAVEQTIAELQTLLDSRMDYWFN